MPKGIRAPFPLGWAEWKTSWGWTAVYPVAEHGRVVDVMLPRSADGSVTFWRERRDAVDGITGISVRERLQGLQTENQRLRERIAQLEAVNNAPPPALQAVVS